MRFAVAGLVFLVVLVVGGVAVLASVNVRPNVQKVEQVIPDDHFPR